MESAVVQGRLQTPRHVVQFRTGLQIAVLAARPHRMKNFGALLLDGDILKRGEDWWISICGEETKNGRPIEVPFPPELVSYLQCYLAQVRPLLAGSYHGRKLWILRRRRPQSLSSIAYGIRRATALRFGRSVNPYLFRDCAATSIALHDPANTNIIASILGHGSFATAQNYYNQARSIDASTRHGTVVLELRAKLIGRKRRRPRQ